MAKKTSQNALYKMNVQPHLSLFLHFLEDLTQIDEKVLIRFGNEEILMYSLVGQGDSIHAFKSHLIPIKTLFQDIKNDLETEVKYIIRDAKKFSKSISGLLNYEESIDVKLVYNEDNFGEKMMIKNSIFRREFPGADPTIFRKDINVEQIKAAMNTDLAQFSFALPKSRFDHLKKESGIESENEIYQLSLKDGVVSIGESAWEIKIAEGITAPNNVISFPKKYFNTISFEKGQTEVTIWVFETFLLILGPQSNLMISIELTV